MYGTAASAAATAASAYMSYEQGQAIKVQDERKARVEADKAKQDQINMRQRMLAALASQNAGTLGAVGTGRGTSFGANTLRQIKEAQNDLMVSSANASEQVSLLDQAGSNAAAAGTIGAVGDLAKGAASAAGV